MLLHDAIPLSDAVHLQTLVSEDVAWTLRLANQSRLYHAYGWVASIAATGVLRYTLVLIGCRCKGES